MLADGMNPVVLMTDQQHSRALQHAAAMMPQAFPNGQPAGAEATAGASPQPASVDAIPRISINPGVAVVARQLYASEDYLRLHSENNGVRR